MAVSVVEATTLRTRIPPVRNPWPRRKRKAKEAFRYAVIVALCLVVLFPVYWMVLSTFQPEKYTLTYPPPLWFRGFNTSAISSLFSQQPIASWLFHSFIVSAVTVVITVVLAVPGAYLLSRLRFRGSGAFGFLLLFTQLMPGAMIIVPELEWYRTLHWTNNLFTLGLLYAAFNVPLGCWILKSSFDTVPNEVIDACYVDGCTQVGSIRRILIPLSRAGLVAVVIVAFFGSWNDYLFASAFLTNRSLYTAGLGIATFISQQNVQLFQLMAAGVVFSLLPVILYVSVQRHVARGLTAGAVK
ncbi:MAG: sugar transporter [Acidimicrobiaceae bacterium]|jgi:multiple sugar transport system permease protein|nr:sugar transporter [Acidimicrobiaceae bacterium]